MDLDTLKTAKALERQINAINKVLKPIEAEVVCLEDATAIEMQIKVELDSCYVWKQIPKNIVQIAMDGALEALYVARDKMIEQLERL